MYFWIGDTSTDTGPGDDLRAMLVSAAWESILKIKQIDPIYVPMIRPDGTWAQMRALNTDPETVGIATAGHGGCGELVKMRRASEYVWSVGSHKRRTRLHSIFE